MIEDFKTPQTVSVGSVGMINVTDSEHEHFQRGGLVQLIMVWILLRSISDVSAIVSTP